MVLIWQKQLPKKIVDGSLPGNIFFVGRTDRIISETLAEIKLLPTVRSRCNFLDIDNNHIVLGEEYIYLRMGRKIQSAQPLKSCPKKAFESSKNKFKKLIITIWPQPAQMQYPPAYPSKTNPWASVISEKQNRNCIVRKITTHDNSTSHPEIPRNSMKSSPWVMSGFSHLKIWWLYKAKSYMAKKLSAPNKLLMEVNIGGFLPM